MTIEEQVEDWKMIKDIFRLAKSNKGMLRASFYHTVHQKVKEYNNKYGIKYDPLNKPK